MDVLNQPEVDIVQLRKYLGEGISDEAAVLREYCWKLILGYLPKEKKDWAAKVKNQQETYKLFVEEFLPESKFPDYPLLMNKKHPDWLQYEEDFKTRS